MMGKLQKEAPLQVGTLPMTRSQRWSKDAEILRQHPNMWGKIEERKSRISRQDMVQDLAGEAGDWNSFDARLVTREENGTVTREVWAIYRGAK